MDGSFQHAMETRSRRGLERTTSFGGDGFLGQTHFHASTADTFGDLGNGVTNTTIISDIQERRR